MSNSNGPFLWAINTEETVNGWSATLTVDHQTFYLQPQENEEQAKWMAEQLLTALGRVVSQLFTNKQNNNMKQQLTAGQLIDQLMSGRELKQCHAPEGALPEQRGDWTEYLSYNGGRFYLHGYGSADAPTSRLVDVVENPDKWEVAVNGTKEV